MNQVYLERLNRRKKVEFSTFKTTVIFHFLYDFILYQERANLSEQKSPCDMKHSQTI